MADVVFNSLSTIKLMPIRAIDFYCTTGRGYAENFNFTIFHLESESNYKMSPVVRHGGDGKVYTLGWRYEFNLYVPHNKYSDNGLILQLEEIRELGADIQLILGNEIVPSSPGAENDGFGVINATDGMWIDNNHSDPESIHYEIESVELRPRLILHINGFTKNIKRLFNVTY